MLTHDQQSQLQALLSQLNRDQVIWLSGYLQGVSGGSSNVLTAQPSKKTAVDIYYATETGNSKGLSLNVMKALKDSGFKVKSTAVNRLKPEDISKENIAIFLVSTHGEGDPPETAVKFFDGIKNAKDAVFDGLSYAVLGLGDKSYEIFCGAANNLSAEISRLGGKEFQDIALFDVDYAAYTPQWIEATVKALNALSGDTGGAVQISAAQAPSVYTGKGYTRLEPVSGVIKEIVNLNDRGSNKETYHIEISYEDEVRYSAGDAAGIMLPLDGEGKEQTPRLYSIASSPSLHENEVHLTVALATYTKEDGSLGSGVASGFLAQKKAGDTLDFYISQNQIFNLPADECDAIMIGPGTGIAPFRSFIYERSERGASGRNWLFFGDQHAHCDFLYQAEWQEHLAMGTLHKLDLAFSRDQDHKIYVQDRLRQNAAELMAWIEGGAALYVCGAKEPMSKDVEKALLEIIAQEKAIDNAAAENYLADMEEQGRYLKDVY